MLNAGLIETTINMECDEIYEVCEVVAVRDKVYCSFGDRGRFVLDCKRNVNVTYNKCMHLVFYINSAITMIASIIATPKAIKLD